ncbi:hypothetical protein BJ166DRAFT_535843 [Pestalotiopsis sp. NC0098]|nr:hypothetical protein BJ166DRAFT_535843 [Pestalotiopsis sp. NC0098]
MAMTLAPYNNAMRLGMGFNSYTQQLCVNDAVIKPNHIKAQERDLRNKAAAAAASGDLPQLPPVDFGDGGPKTGTVSRTVGGVSQTVTWTTKFVDSLSEVTNSMNISGSLEIKYGGVGGKGAGAFIDSNKFKESDLAFHLQVKVVNQVLEGDEITEFNPIKDLPSNQFTDVFGDSFISGFITGGEFNALVCYKVKDKSKLRDIKASAEINFDKVPGLTVSAQGQAHLEESDTSAVAETNVSVSWSGGGEIKDPSIKEWGVKELKAAAIEFPDKVAKFPQRTHAILTKYATLRSYQVAKNKGSPLDYENAGVYTSALLDAYTDYKYLSTMISESILNVQTNGHIIYAKEDTAEIKDYRDEVYADFREKALIFLEQVSHEGTESAGRARQLLEDDRTKFDPSIVSGMAVVKVIDAGRPELPKTVRPPTKPNQVKPYHKSLLGLEKARRDCRLEMIKIVQEVDEVAIDPQVAIDPSRAHVFLSPVLFKMLVPSTALPPRPSPEELEIQRLHYELKSKEKEHQAKYEELKQASLEEREALEQDVEAKKAELEAAQEEINDLKPDAQESRDRREKARLEAAAAKKKKEEAIKASAEQKVKDLISNAETEAEKLRKQVEKLTTEAGDKSKEAQTASDALQAAQKSLDELKSSESANSEALKKAREHEKELTQSVNNLKQQETKAKTALSTATDELSKKEKSIDQLNANLREKETELKRLRDDIKSLKSTAEMIDRLPLRVCQFGSLRLPDLLLQEVSDFEKWSTNWRLGFIGGNLKLTSKADDSTPVFNFGNKVNNATAITDRHKYIPTKINLYPKADCIGGIFIEYANKEVIKTGRLEGFSQTMTLAADERITWYEVTGSHSTEFGKPMVSSLKLQTNRGKSFSWTARSPMRTDRNVWAEYAPAGFSLRGFWGQSGWGIDRLGVVWARDS